MPRGKRSRRSNKDGIDSDDDADTKMKVRVESNHIYFWTDVTKHSCLDLIIAIRKLDKQCNTDDIPIFVHINSYGGCVDAALGAVAAIRASKSKIVSIIEGYAASAATMISVVCNERYMSHSAYLRIHQFRCGFWGTKKEIDDEHESVQKLDHVVKNLYTSSTKMTTKQISKLLGREIDMLPSEALKRGIIDRILK